MRYWALVWALVGCSAVPSADLPFPRAYDSCAQSTEVLHPAVMRIEMGSGGFCSGVLISPTEVLTAGHCLRDEDSILVWPPSGIPEYTTKWASGGPLDEDIALIQMSDKFEPATEPLETAQAQAELGHVLQIVGYGCDAKHDRQLSRRLLTASFEWPEFGIYLDGCACFGDSGAPILDAEGRVSLIAWGKVKDKGVFANDARHLTYLRAKP